MPFRRSFACLWCGGDWQVRGDDDLEGWAALCSDCLAKADDNGFLRGRLRKALRERSAATAGPPAGAAAPAAPSTPAATPTPAHDEWYLRQGSFSQGPLYDGPWGMELDEVTRWLDGLPMSGVIVELAAGTGWWSGLLAEKGELWLYDPDDAALDAARRRLMAHGLLAHLHQRDPLAPADKQVDVVVAAFLLTARPGPDELARRIEAMAAWLKPGGSLVFIETAEATDGGPVQGPAGPLWPRDIENLEDALTAVGLVDIDVRRTQRAFVMGRASSAA